MDKVDNNGRMIFEICLTLYGDEGTNILRSLLKLSGSRINIYGSEGLCRHSLGIENQSSKGIGINGSLNGKDPITKKTRENTWRSITSSGIIDRYNNIEANVAFDMPTLIIK